MLWLFVFQLSPTDRSLHTEWETELDDAKEYVRKLNVISTNKDRDVEVEAETDDTEVSSSSKATAWRRRSEMLISYC